MEQFQEKREVWKEKYCDILGCSGYASKLTGIGIIKQS